MWVLDNISLQELFKCKARNQHYLLIIYIDTNDNRIKVRFNNKDTISLTGIKMIEKAIIGMEGTKKIFDVKNHLDKLKTNPDQHIIPTENTVAFSIILPLYNTEQYIQRAINSVLLQTFQAFELIVIDDASTDNSYTLVEKHYGDHPKVRLFRNPVNLGTYKTQNVGLQKARGTYITVIGADDAFHKERLMKDFNYLQFCKVVQCTYARITDENTTLRRGKSGSTISFHREIVDKVGPFLNCRFGGDTEYLDRIKKHYNVFINHSILYYAYYKADKSNLTKTINKKLRKHFSQYYKLLHEFSNKNINNKTKILMLKLTRKFSLSLEDHHINMKLFNIRY